MDVAIVPTRTVAHRAVRAVLLSVLLLSISACGFHPRGTFLRATELGSIYVDAESGLSIADEVREALLDSAFTLADNRDDAAILLRLTGEEPDGNRVVSITSNGRVSELELTHAVGMFIVESVDGRTPVYSPDQALNRVAVTREYTYDETGVLGKENEARILREEMKVDLVRQIVLRSIATLAPSVTP